MRVLFIRILIITCACTSLFCQKNDSKDRALVKIGRQKLTQDDYESFTATTRAYPRQMPAVFPGDREKITFMVETEVLYSKVPSSIKNREKKSADWKWKQLYFAGQVYAIDVLMNNMGIMREDIERHYEKIKNDSFKVTVRIPVRHETAGKVESADSSTQPAPSDSTDSTYYRPLVEVRNRIIKEMFLKKYPPESSFIAETFGDSLPEKPVIADRWYSFINQQIRTRNQDFFLLRFCKELYGEQPDDSTVDSWAITRGLVDRGDLGVILNWLPEQNRAMHQDSASQEKLLRWLVRWKVYHDYAKRAGYLDKKETRKNIAWAWKLQAVFAYLEEYLKPRARAEISIDTAMCLYAYWDQYRNVFIPADSTLLAREIEKHRDMATAAMLDKNIVEMRKRKGVTFLQSDFRDSKHDEPALLTAQADTLRDTGNIDDAMKIYERLKKDFSYTDEGRKALSEIAKIQTEKERYTEAITNYRLHLVSGGETVNKCNTFFMIGFIYDEYMNKPELAEANYTWILRNARDCELADDAEFMLLHLDEPMIRIEELRGQAIRQGRDVDFDDEEDLNQ